MEIFVVPLNIQQTRFQFRFINVFVMPWRLRWDLGQEEARRNASQGEQRETTAPQGSTSSQQPPTPNSVPSSYGNPSQKPAVVYYGEPTITAIEVRRQKELELRNNDVYWAKRLTQLEQNLQKTNSILEKEYNSAVSRQLLRIFHFLVLRSIGSLGFLV